MRTLTLGKMGLPVLTTCFFLYFSLFAVASWLHVKHEGCEEGTCAHSYNLCYLTLSYRGLKDISLLIKKRHSEGYWQSIITFPDETRMLQLPCFAFQILSTAAGEKFCCSRIWLCNAADLYLSGDEVTTKGGKRWGRVGGTVTHFPLFQWGCTSSIKRSCNSEHCVPRETLKQDTPKKTSAPPV